jgi:nitrogen fixation/metabolism regulation signal transduction histidine kinase
MMKENRIAARGCLMSCKSFGAFQALPSKFSYMAISLALLAVFVAIGVAGALWVANRTIVEPTRRLLKQVNALAGGGGTVQSDGPARAQNELAGLTSAFNRMAVGPRTAHWPR